MNRDGVDLRQGRSLENKTTQGVNLYMQGGQLYEPIEMPFGLRTWVGPRHHVLDGGSDPPWEGANFWGRMGVPL